MAVAQLRIQRRLKEICIVVVRFLSSTHQVKTILIKTCLTSYFSLFRLFITSCMHTPHISSTHKQCKKGIILSAIAQLVNLSMEYCSDYTFLTKKHHLQAWLYGQAVSTHTYTLLLLNWLCVCVIKSALVVDCCNLYQTKKLTNTDNLLQLFSSAQWINRLLKMYLLLVWLTWVVQ